MPHHTVFKKSSTTLLRIVFNASSKPNEGKSLNDCLLTGPSLTAKLHEILLQFRQGMYAVTADISKAFHRIIIDEEDRKFLKFLWINLNSQELVTFQLFRQNTYLRNKKHTLTCQGGIGYYKAVTTKPCS